jgi:uncharacterized protein YoxC
MLTVERLTHRFETVFKPNQAVVLAETIRAAYDDLVKTSDFNELKEIVRDLGAAQKRTEQRVEELAIETKGLAAQTQGLAAQTQELSAAQLDLTQVVSGLSKDMSNLTQVVSGLSRDMGNLTQVVSGLSKDMSELSQVVSGLGRDMGELSQVVSGLGRDMGELSQVTSGLAKETGGLSRAMSYALENEAYRALPAYLERTYGIIMHERIVRTEIDDQEINFFARGEQNGEAICLVGEAKLQLDERRENRRVVRDLIEQLDRQAAAATTLYPDHRMVRLIITHYARPAVLKQAQERGILVVQSFDW